jgi:hypothetical protein
VDIFLGMVCSRDRNDFWLAVVKPMELSDGGWSLLGFHIGAYQASIFLPIQAVYLETPDSHFLMNKWPPDKCLTDS